MKEELDGKMSMFVALKPKTYSYLTYDDRVNKKGANSKCVIKRAIAFGDYKNYLEAR